MNKKLRLVQTCGACPEQYDVYYDEDENSKSEYPIGYMRLRHGMFRAEYKGDVVYRAEPRGDGLFEWDERSRYLNEACKAILNAMKEDEGRFPEDLFVIDS
jgi:hypothetical protein